MCGRINLSDNEGVQALMAMLGVPLFPVLPTPRWNVSPTAQLSTLVSGAMNDDAPLLNTTMRWGLEAPWSEPGKTSRRLINARSETLLSKPTFRDLAKHHRTVVPVNGFYEWQVVGEERIPYYIQVKTLPAMLLAAVYQPMSAEDIAKERVTAEAKAKAKADAKATPQMGFSFDDEPTPAAEASNSNAKSQDQDSQDEFTGDFAVVTTAASSAMADIHHRAPVMLNVEQAKRWLRTEDPAEIESLTAPESIMDVTARRVSRAVNSSRNDGPECVRPADDEN